MPDSKWDRVRGTFDRAHADFEFPTATFENYENSVYNPNTGEVDGTWATIGSIDVEFVPPSVDATINTEGTGLDFDTSIRMPENDLDELTGPINVYGENAEYPTRVTVEGTKYEVQGNPPEHGSGMTMLRLTEL
jgi:hypothetical protein